MAERLLARDRSPDVDLKDKVLCACGSVIAVVAMVHYAGVGLQAIRWYFDHVVALYWQAMLSLVLVVMAVAVVGFLLSFRTVPVSRIDYKRLLVFFGILAFDGLLLVFYAPALAAWPGTVLPTAPLGIHVIVFLLAAALSCFLLWPLIRWVHRLLEK